jgi:teichuronic acid biosynthesis glycosyltransferase TuaH
MNKNAFGLDIIIIGQQPWDTDIGSNCKNIAIELSKNNRVLYVNSPLDRITLLKGRKDPKIIKRIKVIQGKQQGLIKIQDNLWNYYPDCIVESINWIDSHSVFNLINKNNNKKFAKSIDKALKTLGFNNYLLFNDNEMFKGFYLKDFLNPKLSMYYSRDYMIGVDYWKKHGEKLEPLLIAKSDLCFSNSEYLADYCRKYNPNSFYVGQGCEIDDFINIIVKKPADLEQVTTPIIGYVGALNSLRLDIGIIEHIAESFPQYCIVLVGPEDDNFRASKLHRMKNVIFSGQKQVNELPNYINAFDICINPQLVNEITVGNYPRKIDEYLALGKPVVATLTKTMESFSDFVYLAATADDYITLIKKAFDENNDALKTGRIAFALTHTWEQSVKLMTDQINKLLAEKK